MSETTTATRPRPPPPPPPRGGSRPPPPPPPPENDDARHRREEQTRREKRKASKSNKSESQKERERQRHEHRKRVLEQHGGGSSSSGGAHKSGNKRKKTDASGPISAFQEKFTQRAQGFQIDFRFRNAPPRPPVGPCFVGRSLEAVLADMCKQYKPLNAVEVNHTWKLHTEPDLGVPLARSAMDLASYTVPSGAAAKPTLHPDDQALLDWKGSMGDTAADNRKRLQDQSRAAARLALVGRKPINASTLPAASSSKQSRSTKKAFSRVLNEGMQTWMKKTTYLSNDYTRKVHDFKSLAQTKQEVELDLQAKQQEMAKRRSAQAIEASFFTASEGKSKPPQHPTRKSLKPKHIMQLLPNVRNWGRAFTHVVVDKPPQLPEKHSMQCLEKAIVANVEKREANARMTCQLLVPSVPDGKESQEEKKDEYETVHEFDLDVVPLKEEDSPHIHFCLWLDREKGIATYLPISSRVQLSTGRPARKHVLRPLARRPLTTQEQDEMEERMAEVDHDMAEKHDVVVEKSFAQSSSRHAGTGASGAGPGRNADGDDGEGDFGDDDSQSDDEPVFGGGTQTIVAEN